MAQLGLEPIKSHVAGALGRYFVPTASNASKPEWKAIEEQPDGYPRVTFDYFGVPPGYGIHIQELAARGPGPSLTQVLNNANDVVLAGLGLRRINLRIVWPGYQRVNWIRAIELNTRHGPLTRGQLAAEVALNFLRYIETCEKEPIDDEFVHFEFMCNQLHLENLVLISLCNTGPRDVYQAEIQLDWR